MSEAGAALSIISNTVAAGAQLPVDAFGEYFAILDASHDEFSVKVDDGARQPFDKGIKVRMPDGVVFEKITIVNTHATDALTFQLASGVGDISDERLAFIGASLPVAPTAANPAFAVKPEGAATAHPVGPDATNAPFNVVPRVSLAAADYDVTISAGSTTTSLGSSDPHIARRRAVNITNAGAGDLWVRANNSAGKQGHRIAPGEVRRIETQAALYVHNPNSFAVRMTALAEFWT